MVLISSPMSVFVNLGGDGDGDGDGGVNGVRLQMTDRNLLLRVLRSSSAACEHGRRKVGLGITSSGRWRKGSMTSLMCPTRRNRRRRSNAI